MHLRPHLMLNGLALLAFAIGSFACAHRERDTEVVITDDWAQQQQLPDVYAIPLPDSATATAPSDAELQINVAAHQPPLSIHLRNAHANTQTADLDSRNVENLQLAWFVHTRYPVTHQPLVEGDRVYFADWGGTVYAASLHTGQLLWSTQAEQAPQFAWPVHGFVGSGALDDNALYLASVEGTACALDKDTGEILWQRRFTDQPLAGNLGPIAVYDGHVYIGLASITPMLGGINEVPQFQGRIIALHAQDGRTAWQQLLTESPDQGVPVYGGFAIDPDLEALYFTTGRSFLGGQSALSNAIVAVDLKNGSLFWAEQIDMGDEAVPGEQSNQFMAGPQLFEATIDGELRHLVGAGHLNGVYYVWDRDGGARIGDALLGTPGMYGGFNAPASTADGRIFAWSNNSFSGIEDEPQPMNIAAIDAATGQFLWHIEAAQPAGFLAAGFLANDAYFVGSLDGFVHGYDGETGETIWTSERHGAIGSSPWVHENMLLFGTGIGGPFSVEGAANGLAAYRLSNGQSQSQPRIIRTPSLPPQGVTLPPSTESPQVPVTEPMETPTTDEPDVPSLDELD